MAKQKGIPLAVLCSDIHLSHKCPVARTAEESWYEAMKRVLDELRFIAHQQFNCKLPIICAGDVFDRWNSPAELINFAVDNLPEMYAIPGQHDLPNHNMGEIERSAYWTLVQCGVLKEIEKGDFLVRHEGKEKSNGLVLFPFPWGSDIKPLKSEKDSRDVHLAVIHSYIWKDGFGYPNAPKEQRVAKYRRAIAGYDAAVFGDNHKGFHVRLPEGIDIINTGTLMRRKIDEVDYVPQVGILYSTGLIEPIPLSTDDDKFVDRHLERTNRQDDISARDLLEELQSLGGDSLQFRDFVIREMDKRDTSSGVRCRVLHAIDG